MNVSRRRLLIALPVALLLCAGLDARAQAYPVKPIRLIVADAAGGAPDQLGRALGSGRSSPGRCRPPRAR
jgi:tripartite-type tricarboxylate transporter receptor subunit TctC